MAYTSVTAVSVPITTARAQAHQRGRERQVTRRGGIAVARRQRDDRRHPPWRDRLGHEPLGIEHPSVPVLIFQLDRPRQAVPGQVQHMRRLGRQRRPNLAGAGEMHNPHPRLPLPLPGGAHRGQHIAQLPLIIQHPAAATDRRRDRDQHPQRPRHRRRRPAAASLTVDSQQRVQSPAGSASRAAPAPPTAAPPAHPPPRYPAAPAPTGAPHRRPPHPARPRPGRTGMPRPAAARPQPVWPPLPAAGRLQHRPG